MTRLVLPIIAVAVLLSACEPTWFAVEVKASEVCIVDMSVIFPPRELSSEMETSIAEDDLGVELSEALEIDIEVSSVAMAPSDGADLGFAEQIGIEIASMDDPALPRVTLVELRAGLEAPEGGLYGEPEGRVDVTAYIQASNLIFNFELQGELPEVPVAATMDLCLDITASYSE